jgi:hypothetical protein
MTVSVPKRPILFGEGEGLPRKAVAKVSVVLYLA